MTRHLPFRTIYRLGISVALAVALDASAQTPTPTPTPTITPTPIPGAAVTAAGRAFVTLPSGGVYDAANLVVDPDGTTWSASGTENVLLKLSLDGTQATRWPFPQDTAPSSIVKDTDGTIWLTELGGFRIGHFYPENGTLKEWADETRRPTSLVRRPDGKFWLPETSGLLTLFDPVAGTLTYITTKNVLSLSYPLLEADGTLWACDFLVGQIVRFSADGSTARRWQLPSSGYSPSKIIRGKDGYLWISLYSVGGLARFDPTTSELRTYSLGANFLTLPYDLANYKDLIAFTDQRNGFIGFFDPVNSVANAAVTLTPFDVTTTNIVKVAAFTQTGLVPKNDTVVVDQAGNTTGYRVPAVVQYNAGPGAVYAFSVDEKRGRIVYASAGGIGVLIPQIPLPTDVLVPSAASIGGSGGARWKTDVVAWNRGSIATGATVPQTLTFTEYLLPSTWIAGNSPGTTPVIDPGKLLVQSDVIAGALGKPDDYGALRLSPSGTLPGDLYAWARVYVTRQDGGSYGFARNAVLPAASIAAGETGFMFAPPDTEGERTNAGILIVEAATGTLSVVDSSGVTQASMTFAYPAGYHFQHSTIFQALGIPPLPSARIVVSVTTGKVLPFGTSIHDGTNDPVGLDLFRPADAVTTQYVLGAAYGAGPLGSGARTDLQLYAATAATVTLSFRPASAAPASAAREPLATATVTLPAGKVVTLRNVLAETLGLSASVGTLDVVSTAPAFAFSRTYGTSAQGRYGFGLAGVPAASAIAAGSRGVFIADTDNGYDRVQSDLHLTNLSSAPASVTLNATTVDAAAAGTRTLTVPPNGSVFLPGAWYAIAGFGTDVGRLDVVPADGAGPVLATILRREVKTGDVDAMLPFVIPR